MTTWGRVSSNENYYGIMPYDLDADSNEARGYIPDAMPWNLWVTRMILLVGRRGSSTPECRGFIYDLASGATPTSRRAYTEKFLPSNQMLTGSDGQQYYPDIAWVNDGASPDDAQDVVQLWKGKHYLFGVTAYGKQLTHGMRAAAEIPDRDYYWFKYDNNLSSSIPPSTFDLDSTTYEGHMTVAVEGQVNSKPTLGTIVPANAATVTTLTPTFTVNFVDADAALGDKMTKVWIQVRQQGQTTLKWSLNGDAATSGERSAAQVNRVYAGSALAYATTYEVQYKVADSFNEESAWSGWRTFTVAAAGTVGTPTAPTGKVETVTPSPFTAVWTHATGLSAKTARVLLYRNNILVGTVADVTLSPQVANGGTISVTFAQTGYANLLPGGLYEVAMQAQDTANVWSTISARKTFTVNAPPNLPTIQTPPNGSIVTSRPPMVINVTDKDDTQATGLEPILLFLDARPHSNGAFAAATTGFAFLSESIAFTDSLSWASGIGNLANGSADISISAVPGTANQSLVYEFSDQFPVLVGFTYTHSVWLRKDHATDLDANGRINWYNASNVLISSTDAADIDDTAGTFFESRPSGVAPATATYYKMAVRIKNPATSIGGTRHIYVDDASVVGMGVRVSATTTYNGTLQRWQFTPTSTQMPTIDRQYGIQATGWDGTYYSGGVTSLAAATLTSILLVNYTTGPIITVTAPTASQVYTTDSPFYTFAMTGGGTQATLRAIITKASDGSLVWDSGFVGSIASTGVQQAAGFLRDQGAYLGTFGAKNTLGVEGYAAPVAFSVDYVDPPALSNVVATLVTNNLDISPSGIRVRWDPTAYPPTQFVAYLVYRGLVGAIEPKELIAEITNISVDHWDDFLSVSGESYEYDVRQVVLINLDTLTSAPALAQNTLVLQATVIHDVLLPGYRLVMRYYQDKSEDNQGRYELEMPIGGDKPFIYEFPDDFDVIDMKAQFDNDAGGAAMDYYRAGKELRSRKGRVLCLRDPRGRITFGKLTAFKEYDLPKNGQYVDVDVQFTQSADVPGVLTV